jgi:FkbM family methyltransferase
VNGALRSLRVHAGAARDRVRRRQLERRLAGPRLLSAFAEIHPAAHFVEVGSNDGEQHDHLRPYILERAWRGIMVEPVPYVFERLQRNYEGIDRVKLENAAIADRDGTQSFYYLVAATPVERERLPDWYDGIGSFSREALTSHATHIPDIEQRIVQADVDAITFDTLCRRNAMESVDLLLIDTEGYDAQILGAIDLGRWAPTLIVYEHYHLTADARATCAARIRACGYATMEEGFDTFCLREDADPRLLELWNSLTPAVAGVAKYDELP